MEELVSVEGAVGGAEGADNSQLLIELINAQEMFAVQPLPWCPHLEEVTPLPARGLDITQPCIICEDTSENWVCLTCYDVMCGRFVNRSLFLSAV